MSPAPLQAPSQRSLAPSVTSVISVSINDKDANVLISGTVRRSPGFYITAEENPGKPQLGDFMMTVVPDVTPNGIPYLQMTSVESHNISGRKK